MFDDLLGIIAPHHCYMCDKKGSLLCDSCIYNIANEAFVTCFQCQKAYLKDSCTHCTLPYKKSWMVGMRENELGQLIDDYKWHRARSAYAPLAQLLDKVLPLLPSSTVVVAVPTIPRHIRRRGYDHAKLIAKEFARLRDLEYSEVLERKNYSVQHTATKKDRTTQAEEAFCCTTNLNAHHPYLIIDDIVTTGATIKAATRVLQRADAQEVWVAAIARQPLKK